MKTADRHLWLDKQTGKVSSTRPVEGRLIACPGDPMPDVETVPPVETAVAPDVAETATEAKPRKRRS